MKGFKYQIVVKVLLNKQNQKIEFAPVNFNSTTKTVIISNMTLTNLFKKFCTELMIRLMKDLVE